MVAVGVGIQISRAVPEAFRVAAGIAQMIGHLGVLFFDGRKRVEESHGAVRLFRSGKIERRVRQKIAAFGKPHAVESLRAGVHHGDSIRIGEAGVLAGGNQHPPENKARILAGGGHTRKPVHRRVGIAPAQTFDERADNVIMIVAVAVVQHDFFLNGLLGGLPRNINRGAVGGNGRIRVRLPFFGSRLDGKLQRVQERPGVAVRGLNQMFERTVLKFNLPVTVAALRIGKSLLGGLAEVGAFQSLELKDAGTAHERLVHLEERIFSRRADQNNRAVLHPRQKRVLLRPVPAVNLVHEQNGAAAVQIVVILGLFDCGADVGDTGQDGVQRDEIRLCVIGDDARESRLARTGRPVKNNGRKLVGGNRAAEQPPFPHDMILPDVLVKIARAHPRGERLAQIPRRREQPAVF